MELQADTAHVRLVSYVLCCWSISLASDRKSLRAGLSDSETDEAAPRDPAFSVRVPLDLGDSSSDEDGDEQACTATQLYRAWRDGLTGSYKIIRRSRHD